MRRDCRRYDTEVSSKERNVGISVLGRERGVNHEQLLVSSFLFVSSSKTDSRWAVSDAFSRCCGSRMRCANQAEVARILFGCGVLRSLVPGGRGVGELMGALARNLQGIRISVIKYTRYGRTAHDVMKVMETTSDVRQSSIYDVRSQKTFLTQRGVFIFS